MNNELEFYKRELPHWTLKGETYFVTFCVKSNNTLSNKEQSIVKNHILEGNDKFYKLISFVIMPNHVHIILKPIKEFKLQNIMKGIKGVSAHKINQHRKANYDAYKSINIWQDESYDRIIRNEIELQQKLEYIFFNPSKNGYTNDPWNYSGYFINEDFFELY
jgi:REP element-mobilizing transposase RayT